MKKRDLTSRKAYRGMTYEEAQKADAKHKEILHVLTGLLLVMFIGMLSNTIVSNAMPVIVAEIGGNATHYTWILTSGILANTVMTALSGKLADLYNKKTLFMISMVLFCLGSLLCGLAWSPEVLIAFRVIQGIAMGMQVMLSMVIMASVIPPRARGRYNGYMGAVLAVATVSGPLIGGVIVDLPGFGWRACFWAMIPFMALAIWVIHRNLDIDHEPLDHVHLDFLGAGLITASTVSILLWVSLIGNGIGVLTPTSLILLGIGIVSVILLIVVEKRSPEPLIPLDILTHKNTVLAIIALLGSGSLMFGSNVFLGQYFQYGRQYSPTEAGLLTLPMMLGITICSTWVGRLITKNAVWKRYVVAGQVALVVSSVLLCFATQDSNLVLLGVVFFIMGCGLGASMQNLVLAVQNTVPLSRMGAATSTVTFFRNFCGGLGIQVLGATYAFASTQYVVNRLGSMPDVPAGSAGSLDLGALPDGPQAVVRAGFGNSLWAVFAVTALACLIGLICVIAMEGTSLRDTVDLENRKTPQDIIAEDDRVRTGTIPRIIVKTDEDTPDSEAEIKDRPHHRESDPDKPSQV